MSDTTLMKKLCNEFSQAFSSFFHIYTLCTGFSLLQLYLYAEGFPFFTLTHSHNSVRWKTMPKKKLIRFFLLAIQNIFYEKKSIFFQHYYVIFQHFSICTSTWYVSKIYLILSPHAHTKCLSLQTKNPCAIAIACAFSLYTLSLSLWQGQKKIFLLALSLSPLDDFY